MQILPPKQRLHNHHSRVAPAMRQSVQFGLDEAVVELALVVESGLDAGVWACHGEKVGGQPEVVIGHGPLVGRHQAQRQPVALATSQHILPLDIEIPPINFPILQNPVEHKPPNFEE